MLETVNLSVRYGDHPVVSDVSFSVNAGDWLMLIGPNGAGKSTVVTALSRGVPYSGTIRLDGCDIRKQRSQTLARAIGILAQNHAIGYAFTVEEVVRLGRYAYSKGMLSGNRAEDSEKVGEALRLTGLYEIRDRSVLTLSGGELQRTFLAQLFAQDPKILVLDEPSNHLDLKYQKLVFSLVSEWLRQSGRAAISVVHDLTLARIYGTRVILMNRGRVIASGAPEEIFRSDVLDPVYGLDVRDWMGGLLRVWQA